MGQQQLLLIVVGVVIIGLMIAFGIFMFRDQAAATNRDNVMTDLLAFGAAAQEYYRRPSMYGGGGNGFSGLTMRHLSRKADGGIVTNSNGSYNLPAEPISGSPDHITLLGTGTEMGFVDTDPIQVVMLVYPDSMRVDEAAGN